MAGKNTSKVEHQSNLGYIIKDYHLSDGDISQLSKLIGCSIDSNNRETLDNLITNFKAIKKANDIKQQDIKRTLAAMSKLDAVKVIDAYNNCDIHTKAHIMREIYLMKKEGKQHNIIEAISRAENRANKIHQKGGRPNKSFIDEFVTECLMLWVAWSDKPITNYVYLSGSATYNENDKPSATLEWCQILLKRLIDDIYDYRDLRKVISKNKGKVSPP